MQAHRALALVCGVLLAASWAEAARTPARVCRKVCTPLVSALCPPKGKALRSCRTRTVRACRRQGVVICAFGAPTGGPFAPGLPAPPSTGVTTTTVPLAPSTTTTAPAGGVTTTTTVPAGGVTTTTLGTAPSVAGAWTFEATLTQPGCGFAEPAAGIVSHLTMQQVGAALQGSIEQAPATGEARTDGWTFATLPECRTIPGSEGPCCFGFSIVASGTASPSPASGSVAVSCEDGSTCSARWTGTVARTP